MPSTPATHPLIFAASRDLADLLRIMAALRDPVAGCSWDLAQSFESLAPYAIEEAYEVADAVARQDHRDLRDELGDLLLQVVFHAQIADEAGLFDFGGVVEAITAKLVRRHPHIFGDARDLTPEAVKAQWDTIKAAEKAMRPEPGRSSVLDGVPLALPGLTRAVKLQAKAGTVGFEWNDPRAVIAKIREEIDEVEVALDAGDKAGTAEEIGDLLFAVANVARHLDIDPEAAIRAANAKFHRRFGFIEAALAQAGKTPAQSDLAEMEALWQDAKRAETMREPGVSPPASDDAARATAPDAHAPNPRSSP